MKTDLLYLIAHKGVNHIGSLNLSKEMEKREAIREVEEAVWCHFDDAQGRR